jgi:Family of unknown function (DUF6232)
MKVKQEEVEFRISRRTLWVGMQAYPLSQVSRVRPIEVNPRRGRILLRYGRSAGATVGVGAAGLIVLACLGNAAPTAVTVVFLAAIVAAVVAHSVRLVRRLLRGRLYILSVSTAGSQQAALVSRDRDLIYDLTYRVVDAIDNPAAEFQIRVENLEFVNGDKYDGDHVEGNKIPGDWG